MFFPNPPLKSNKEVARTQFRNDISKCYVSRKQF